MNSIGVRQFWRIRIRDGDPDWDGIRGYARQQEAEGIQKDNPGRWVSTEQRKATVDGGAQGGRYLPIDSPTRAVDLDTSAARGVRVLMPLDTSTVPVDITGANRERGAMTYAVKEFAAVPLSDDPSRAAMQLKHTEHDNESISERVMANHGIKLLL